MSAYPYATLAQALERLGESYLISLTDVENEGAVDADRLTGALVSASAEIDSHIGTRYTTPVVLDPVPLMLVEVCLDIAEYRLARGVVPLTDEVKERYDRATRWLGQVAQGKAGIGIATANVTADADDVILYKSAKPSVFGGGDDSNG